MTPGLFRRLLEALCRRAALRFTRSRRPRAGRLFLKQEATQSKWYSLAAIGEPPKPGGLIEEREANPRPIGWFDDQFMNGLLRSLGFISEQRSG